VHFTDTWTELGLLDLVRLLAPTVPLIATLLLPGRRVARPAMLVLAAAMAFIPELGPWPLVAGWVLLLLFVAWQVGLPAAVEGRAKPRPGGRESGLVGLSLGLALLALLTAGVARQDLAPEDGRRASLGLLLLGLGLLHLMMRRHARRSMVGFAALGLGLQMLHGAALGAEIPEGLPAPGLLLLCSAMTVALVGRVARGRERLTGNAWIHDAHDLHD
jgi:hypothetical protein